MGFPNRAGAHADTDDILRAELKAAGIPTMQEAEGKPPEFMADLLRSTSGEVKTSVIGCLHGWTFKRAWYYWMCSGPGIEVAAAERLHAEHGRTVRVGGHCGCPSPREWFKGLACGHYHVDTTYCYGTAIIRNCTRMTPNDRVEGRDAALSRRVPSHDGLGGADLRRKT